MANPYIQNDGTSSGAFLIENMYLDMNPDVVRQELTSENIYELHQELMSRNKRKERDDDTTLSAKYAKK